MRVAAAACLTVLLVHGAVAADRHQVTGAMDMSYVRANSGQASWLHGGSGKLRFDENHDGLRVSRMFVDYRLRLTTTLFGRATVNVNNDVGNKVDLTEAFVEWRPLPRSGWRFRTRFGAFYPRLSLENVEAGWTNAYALTSSVINTWIAEELRTVGAELRVTHDLPGLPDQQLTFEVALFAANDPTGAQLTWRSWSAHDRQTGLFGEVPMPAVSAIEAWVPGGNPDAVSRTFQGD